MAEVEVAWLTARTEVWRSQGLGSIVVACGSFDSAVSGQLGFVDGRVYLHWDIILHT